MDDGKYDDDFPTEDKPVEIITIKYFFLLNKVTEYKYVSKIL